MPVGLMSIEDAKKLMVWMEEHDAEIRRQTLDEFREKINDYLVNSYAYGDFVVTDTAIDCVIEQMKEVRNE